MKYIYNFSYLPCQSCHAKVNCSTCAENILSELHKHTSLHAEIDIFQKNIVIESTLDADTVEEVLENLGVFV